MSKRKLDTLFKRYKVTLRKDDQKVTHAAYGCTTILTPDQFAVFEAAAKAIYISNQVYHKNNGMRQFLGCMVYHQENIFGPNDIDIPYIADAWTDEKGEQAASDYRHCADLLGRMSGRDAETQKERNLYYACLD